MRKITLVLSLGAVCASILSGCQSKNKYKVPTNAHDKVQVAFNGVEKSFANYKDNSASSSARTRSFRKTPRADCVPLKNARCARLSSATATG